MAWLRITLTDAEQAVVEAERDPHPDAHVRRKMLVLRWHTLVRAVTEATGKVEYFVTNAVGESPATILAVAFRRATGEPAVPVAKTRHG